MEMECVKRKLKPKLREKSVQKQLKPKVDEVAQDPYEANLEKLSATASCLKSDLLSDLGESDAKPVGSELKSTVPSVPLTEVKSTVDKKLHKGTFNDPSLLRENTNIKDSSSHLLENAAHLPHLLCSELPNQVASSEKQVLLETSDQNVHVCAENLDSLNFGFKKLYPNLTSIESDVLVYHSLIQTYSEQFMMKTYNLASKACVEFFQGTAGLSSHEFFELVLSFETSRHRLLDIQHKTVSLQFSIKNKSECLWDIISKEVSAKGFCDDGNAVLVSRACEVFELNDNVEADLKHKLSELENTALPDLTFLEYTVQILRRKIELYIYYLLQNSDGTTKKHCSPSATFSSLTSSVPRIETMKTCISILFYFQRKPASDDEFITMTRNWLTYLISGLLSFGTSLDRLFILNHVLRLPADISSWATCFIQLPPVYSLNNKNFENIFDSDIFHFALPAFYMILNPVPGRDEFLKDIKTCDDPPPDCSFTILNDDGGEAEEKYKFIKEWGEVDIFSLFRQIPLHQIFQPIQHLFPTEDENSGKHKELNMQKTIAFSSFLLNIFDMGFKTETLKLHSSVRKAIGNFVCQTLHYLSEQWTKFKSENLSYDFCLQVEVDRVMFHAVFMMLDQNDVGVLELLCGMPYDCVSPKVLWNLLWLYHKHTDSDEQTIFSEKDVENKLKSASARILLQTKLKAFDEISVFHILKTLEKMALSKGSEKQYVCCIAQEIFEISCSCGKLDNLPKQAIELLSNLAEQHLAVISFLLRSIKESSDDDVLKCAVVLFNTLPFAKWVPETADIDIISSWLLSGSLSSVHNQLARTILKRLNWGFEGGKLVLPVELHRHVGVLIVKAYLQYDTNGDSWVVSKGIKQMLHLYTPILFQNAKDDKGFIAWAWQLLFALKLHVLNHPNPPWIKIFDGEVDHIDLPNVHQDSFLHALLLAYKQKHPAACFLVIAMTNVGHSLKFLSNEGLEIISTLLDLKQYAAAVQSLYLILPFFVKSQELLVSNQKFLTCLSKLIIADRIACNNRDEIVFGTVLCKIQDMIKIQLFQAWKLTVECVNPLIKLWVELLVELLILNDRGKLELDSGVNQVYCLLDLIVKIAFLHPHMQNGLIEFLSYVTRPLLQPPDTPKQSLWSTLFGNAVKVSPLLPQPSALHSWFAWSVILSEVNQKMVQEFWFDIQNQMVLDSSLTPELAFKKSSDVYPSSPLTIHNLPLYRWGSQTLETPIGHPLLPLMWQNFYLYFLQRTTNISGTNHRKNSIGLRFFNSGTYVGMLKKMKIRLKATLEFYHKLSISLGEKENISSQNKTSPQSQSPQNACSKSVLGTDSGCQDCSKDVKHANELFMLFQAFSCWIEDTSLHGPICLPALQPKYLPDKLKFILENDQRPWLEYVDTSKIRDDTLPMSHLWNPEKEESVYFPVPCEPKGAEDIQNSTEVPLTFSPVRLLEPPIPEIRSNMLASPKWLTRVLSEDQKVICSEAVKFQTKLLKLKSLNDKYKCLFPEKYRIEHKVLSLKRPCHRNTKCSGPANFKLTVPKVVQNDRVAAHITHNRSDFQKILDALMSPPSEALCTAAMHMEILLRKLVKEVKIHSSVSVAEDLRKQGISLFYDQLHNAEEISTTPSHKESVPMFSPSKQFFSTCIDILGKELILGQEDQCLRLLETLLKKPAAAELASSYFCPHKVSANNFLSIYETLVKSMSLPNISPCAIFVLLSKIKVSTWLCERHPVYSCKEQLLKTIGTALNSCGYCPDADRLPLYEIFKKHFCELLMYEFPDLFPEAIRIILNGSESSTLNGEIWYALFRCLGCPVSPEEKKMDDVNSAIAKFAQNRLLTPDQKLFVSSPPLHCEEVIHSLEYLHQYFMRERNILHASMYKKYRNYIKPISVFLGMMNYSLLELSSDDYILPQNKTSKVSYVWGILHRSFEPWLDPRIDCALKNLQFPWSIEEEEEAITMMQMFSSCIEFHHNHFKDVKCDLTILSYAWNYYVTTYVRGGFRNYSITVFHTTFCDIPWHTFYPTEDDIKMMSEVLQYGDPECCKFLSGISMKVPWMEVMSNLMSKKSSYVIECTLSYLAKLFVRSGWEYSVVKVEKSYLKLLKELEVLPWQVLKLDSVREILDIYTNLCNPKNLLSSNADRLLDIHILSFLKVVSGLIPKSQMAPCLFEPSGIEFEQKRCLFLNKVISLITQLVSFNDFNNYVGDLSLAVPSYLKDIEEIISKDFPSCDQIKSSIPLVKEVLVFFNSIEDEKKQQKILNSTLTWLASNSKTPLLLPCIRAACFNLVSVSSVVAVVECCINARYSAELQDPSEAKNIWHLVSTFFQVPDDKQDEFLESCFEQSACLCLYEYVHRRTCMATSGKHRAMLFSRMIFWIQKIKLVESSEAKMILLWDQVLEVSLNVVGESDIQVVESGLISFCKSLSLLGEDRSGLLSLVFLNKSPLYSVNFRFLCRALSTYILLQMPENGTLRLDPYAAGHASQIAEEKNGNTSVVPRPSRSSLKALEELKNLVHKPHYAALKSQIERTLNYIFDPKFSFLETRELLKELALQMFPNHAYLHLLHS